VPWGLLDLRLLRGPAGGWLGPDCRRHWWCCRRRRSASRRCQRLEQQGGQHQQAGQERAAVAAVHQRRQQVRRLLPPLLARGDEVGGRRLVRPRAKAAGQQQPELEVCWAGASLALLQPRRRVHFLQQPGGGMRRVAVGQGCQQRAAVVQLRGRPLCRCGRLGWAGLGRLWGWRWRLLEL
jgi:hypothetical protein